MLVHGNGGSVRPYNVILAHSASPHDFSRQGTFIVARYVRGRHLLRLKVPVGLCGRGRAGQGDAGQGRQEGRQQQQHCAEGPRGERVLLG